MCSTCNNISMSGEDENVQFLSAYSDLSFVLSEDNIEYYEYKTADQATNIIEALENYINVVNNLSSVYKKRLKIKRFMNNMWKSCHTYIPLVFGFSPSSIQDDTNDIKEMTDTFKSFIITTQISRDITIMKKNMYTFGEKIRDVELFVNSYNKYEELDRILVSIKSAHHEVENTYERHITEINFGRRYRSNNT